MSIRYLEVSLRAWYPDGRTVGRAEFFEPLRATGNGDVPTAEESELPSQAARLVFLEIPVVSSPLSQEVLATRVSERLDFLVRWLREREPAVFEELRERGLKTDLYIDAGIDDEELDFELPHPLLLECGRRGLDIVSNAHDFSIDRD